MAKLEREVRASVARCPRTPPYAATRKDLRPDWKLLTQPPQPEHSCHSQLQFDPITAVSCRAKDRSLDPRRSYFAPAAAHRFVARDKCRMGWGGGAGYRPRVRKAYYNVRLSPYPACAGTQEYRGRERRREGRGVLGLNSLPRARSRPALL